MEALAFFFSAAHCLRCAGAIFALPSAWSVMPLCVHGRRPMTPVLKLHPDAVRAAGREGATWIVPPQPWYCGPCDRRLAKAAGVVHIGRRAICADCFTRGA